MLLNVVEFLTVTPSSGLVNLSYNEDQDSSAAQDVISQITESASVEVVIDDDGLMEHTESKRARKDDTLGTYIA